MHLLAALLENPFLSSYDGRSSYDLAHAVSDNRLVGIWRLMRGFRWTYLAATVTLGLGAFARTGTYLWLRYFVDEILNNSPTISTLFLVALGFLGLALIQGGFTFLSGSLAAKTAESIARRLKNFLFDHVQRLSFTYHDQTSTGELIQRSTSDVEAIRRFFADQAIGAGRILLLFTINLAAIASLNGRLAILSILVIPLIVIMSYFFFRRVSKAYEAYQEQEATLSTALQENLTGVRVVKAFARQAYEIDKFERENWEKFQRGKRLLTMHSLYWPISDILSAGQMLAGLIIGALMTINGTISIGTYLAYGGMIIWLIWPMRNLGRLIVQMSTGLVSYGRIIEVMRETREPMQTGREVPRERLRGEVVFENICFAYEGSDIVLEDISFRCEPGQAIALLGPTGSGKTTLVNLLPRFYEYTDGSLTIDGVELKEYSRKSLRQQIGIVEQEPFLFSRSIRDNITYGVVREISEEEIEHTAVAAAIDETIQSFPEGYDTLVGEKGVTLSGGQKQRIAIARALLKDPRILILDDSTSSVDMETESLIRGALQRLMEGRTTFIIAHRIQSVMNADLILVLDQGRIVQRGTHETLIQEEGIYRRIHAMQTRIEDALEEEIASVSV
ncbi:MAG: ABC transporter ATP-binding protein [Anaerolineaceae bacterium]|nr:MAG: ABC transporter ATP-binding protein [Anaerolineaceae bacterium]